MKKRENSFSKVNKVILPIAAILIIVIIVQLIYARREASFTELKCTNGVLDVSDIDFTDDIYTISNNWSFYPNELLDSEDFKYGSHKSSETRPNKIPYGTHRLILKCRPNEYYTLCGYSVDYGSKIMVNGTTVAEFGKVAANKDEAVHKTGYQTIPIYTGNDGNVEIICQYVNFVHNDGGTIHATYISTPQNIENYKTGISIVSITLGGSLLILALYFLLSYAVQKQRNYLLLAFCCLVFSLRDQFFAFISLMPSLSWSLGYRFYILDLNLLPVSILLLMGSILEVGKLIHKKIYLSISLVFVILIFSLDTRVLPLLNVFSYVLAVLYLFYLIFSIVRKYKKIHSIEKYHIISFIGFCILGSALILEGISTFNNAAMIRYGVSPIAMLIFIFLTSLSISLQIQSREAELSKSLSKSNMLETMNTMNIDFLHKVAHELKTPLTVISGYAQLTRMQLSMGNISEETPENLKTIQNEATRLADMVTRLMEYSYGKQSSTDLEMLSVKEILTKAQAICTPMCIKNNNKIILESDDSTIFGNGELLLQVFINLTVNANRHTKDGTITITAQGDSNSSFVIFKVSDTGEGISKEHLPHIFEKGYSGDGGTGLGLTICAEAVEAQGGTIKVESTDNNGSVFSFKIPKGDG